MHCNEVPWRWSKPEQEAFENIKAALCLDSIPCNPDPTVEAGSWKVEGGSWNFRLQLFLAEMRLNVLGMCVTEAV